MAIKLSPYHKIFYVEWLLNPESSQYNMLTKQVLYGHIDINKLKKAFERYVAEHVLLNSHVQIIDGELYWVKNEYISELEYIDKPISNPASLEFINNNFDLNKGPLYRFRLVQIRDNVYEINVILHHLLVDGASVDEGLFESMSNYYNNSLHKAKYSIDEQISLLETLSERLITNLEENKENCKQFWQDQLLDIEGIDFKFLQLDINFQRKSLTRDIQATKEIKFSFDKEYIDQLNLLKRKYLITPFLYSQCIFAIAVYKYSLQKNFAISYPVAIKEGMDFIYGGQVNTSLIPFKFSKDMTIIDLFTQDKEFFKSLKQSKINYSYYPITEIMQVHTKDLLNVFFTQANFKTNTFNFNGLAKVEKIEDFDVDFVDILLVEQELKNNRLDYRIRYDERLINVELLEHFTNSFKKLFIEFLGKLLNENDNPKISDYCILDYKQYQEIVNKWSMPNRSSLEYLSIAQEFYNQVLKYPNNIAIVCEGKKLTYDELNKRSNQLSHYFINNHFNSNSLVGMYVPRSEHMLICMLAILKANCICVPINLTYTDNIVQNILKDNDIKNIIISKDQNDRFYNNYDKNITYLFIEDIFQQSSLYPNSNPDLYIQPKSLSYIMFTSGTTGKPKGIKLKHINIVSLVKYINYITISSDDSIMQLADISFDASLFEIWGALLNGAKLCIVRNIIQIISDPILFQQYLSDNKISILWLTKTLFDQLYLQKLNLFHNLKYLLIGGEALNYGLINKLINSNDKPKHLINAYGPTENTTFSCTLEIQSKNLLNIKSVPIGKPITNRFAYVLDNDLLPVPPCVIGNLYVGGAGLSDGYLNTSQDNQKFILNKFNISEVIPHNINNLYKTGDLVRWLPDGNLDYIERDDFQVKIRGFRIELSAIEYVLSTYVGIKQSVVIIKDIENENNEQTINKYIVAYYVSDKKINEDDLFKYLAQNLPEYMIPKILVNIEKFPFTASGKIDRKNLPIIDNTSVSNYSPPTNKLELKICNVFSKVLKIDLEKVGIYDDFFKLGGNSILVIQLIIGLQDSFKINVNDILKLRTPEKIAKFAPNTKYVLLEKIDQIKLLYKKMNYAYLPQSDSDEKICQDDFISNNLKLINKVLLTGATGHLGCNILFKLLSETDYNIVLLVRANSNNQAFKRLSDKFNYYFNQNLNDFKSRLYVLAADIKKINFGLNTQQYKKLVLEIDSIIHCAALVKHYGNYNEFYETNVQGTVNLLELAKMSKGKDFHYISTVSMLIDGYIADMDYWVIDEDNNLENLVRGDNVYAQTKYEAEIAVASYRKYNLTINMYRVGNLGMNSLNYRNQENIQDNIFFSHIKAMLEIGIIPTEFSNVEISPVDCTAAAIVKLFDKKYLSDKTYHVFNAHTCNLVKLFKEYPDLNIREGTLDEFIKKVLIELDIDNNKVNLFMLYQVWVHEIEKKYFTEIKISQEKTNKILQHLGFFWPEITAIMLTELVQQVKN